jgi:hypothetical protein
MAMEGASPSILGGHGMHRAPFPASIDCYFEDGQRRGLQTIPTLLPCVEHICSWLPIIDLESSTATSMAVEAEAMGLGRNAKRASHSSPC